jgi:hypothetical protein
VDEPLEGIAAADARLGRAFPLPAAPLPLARWVDVRPAGDGTEVVWSLDDSRPGAPGRLVLYAGPAPPPEHDVAWDGPPVTLRLASGVPAEERTAALDHAQASLRPVRELRWRADGLHLRLTGQGPWGAGELAAIAGSVAADR